VKTTLTESAVAKEFFIHILLRNVHDTKTIYNVTALYKEWMVKEATKVPVRQ
jgi:hypothetical protein